MSDGAEIRHRRESLNLSQADLAAAVGTTQQTIDKLEKDQIKFSRYTSRIQSHLDALSKPASVDEVAAPATRVEPLVGERDLPVHGATEGGRGLLVISSDPVDYVRRPQPLAKVKDGYAVICVGDSMIPAFEPGDIVLIHPHLPPRPGCDVVLYRDDGHGTVHSTIKRLVGMTQTLWKLRQWTPPDGDSADFTLPRKEWSTCHRVVGKYSGR